MAARGAVHEVGKDQLLLFVVTCVVTLATDLLVGVGAGVVLKMILHVARGVPVRQLFKNEIRVTRDGDTMNVAVIGPAVFTNLLGLRRVLGRVPGGVREVVVDFSRSRVVDHTTLERVHAIADEWPAARLKVVGSTVTCSPGSRRPASPARSASCPRTSCCTA